MSEEKKTKTLTIRLDSDLRKTIEEKAKKEGKSRASIVRDALENPNRKTREAMASIERGEGVACKDTKDLLRKLKD